MGMCLVVVVGPPWHFLHRIELHKRPLHASIGLWRGLEGLGGAEDEWIYGDSCLEQHVIYANRVSGEPRHFRYMEQRRSQPTNILSV